MQQRSHYYLRCAKDAVASAHNKQLTKRKMFGEINEYWSILHLICDVSTCAFTLVRWFVYLLLFSLCRHCLWGLDWCKHCLYNRLHQQRFWCNLFHCKRVLVQICLCEAHYRQWCRSNIENWHWLKRRNTLLKRTSYATLSSTFILFLLLAFIREEIEMIHITMLILHLLAFLFFFPALFFTIPIHLLISQM